MTPSERQVASRAFKAEWLPKYGLGAAKSLFFLALGLLGGVLMVAQAVAILHPLARPGRRPHRRTLAEVWLERRLRQAARPVSPPSNH